ncbi:MAG TPA: phospholipid scramblase-related protein [Euzebyales bacterium]|nr:phospholipid scramblase-related protein [Euzebyales bacterium]
MAALLEADTLVVSQKAKLIELTNQYEIHSADGARLGYVEQEGQSRLRKLARFASTVDQFLTHRLAVYDADHAKVLELTRPAKLMKSRVTVEDGDGRKVGEIVQQNVFGKIRFDLMGAHGERLGQIRAENWRAWDFSIVDRDETEVARIDKKFVGVLKGVFTTADNYVVHLQPGLDGGLRLLAIAAAGAVDTALKQDPRGIDITDVADFI